MRSKHILTNTVGVSSLWKLAGYQFFGSWPHLSVCLSDDHINCHWYAIMLISCCVSEFNWTNRLLSSLAAHVSVRQQANQMAMFHRKWSVWWPCNNRDAIFQTIVCMSLWRMKKQRLLWYFIIIIYFMKDFLWDKNFCEQRASRQPLSQSLHMRENTQLQHQLTVPLCYCITHLGKKSSWRECSPIQKDNVHQILVLWQIVIWGKFLSLQNTWKCEESSLVKQQHFRQQSNSRCFPHGNKNHRTDNLAQVIELKTVEVKLQHKVMKALKFYFIISNGKQENRKFWIK